MVGTLLGWDNPSLLRRSRQPREKPALTVCIAAICNNEMIFGASDRMLTSGDVQFEPPTPKIWSLTNSIAVLTAGDAAFHKEVLHAAGTEAEAWVQDDPSTVIPVAEAADMFVRHRNALKLKRAEAALLAPLNLDRDSFLTQQQALSDRLVDSLARDLINFPVPGIETIIAGIDATGPHIYVVRDGEVVCCDAAGFACIGTGGRHAESQFMLAQHGPSRGLSDTLLLTYAAKRRAEIAPGVGQETDLFVVGPAVGTLSIVHQGIVDRLEQAYGALVQSEASALWVARTEIAAFVDELASPTPVKQEAEGDYLAADGEEGADAAE
jgi:hypothetical protein